MVKKLILATLGLVVASAICSHGAYASTTTSSMGPWPTNSLGLRLGAFFPASSSARSFGGKTELTAGLDYKLPSTQESSATDAYFDYVRNARNFGYVHSAGLGLDVRGMTGPTFYGAGLGIYNTSVRSTSGTFGTRTGPGGKIFAGMDMGRTMSLQFDYHIMPSALGLNPTGLGVEIGFHL